MLSRGCRTWQLFRRLETAEHGAAGAVAGDQGSEAELGVRLFDRTTRRVELTDAGREFQQSAAKVIEELEHAVESVHELAERKRGRLTVAAPAVAGRRGVAAGDCRIPPALSGISVQIADVGTEQIVESVCNGKADCGIGIPSPSEEGIERVALVRDSLMLFCDEASPLNGIEPVRWNELADYPLVTLTRDSGIRLLVEVGFESCELPLKPAFEVAQVTTAIALVEAGLGVAVLPT